MGRLLAANLDTQSPGVGPERTDSGNDAIERGELHGRGLGRHVTTDESRGDQFARERQQVGEIAVHGVGRRTSEFGSDHVEWSEHCLA